MNLRSKLFIIAVTLVAVIGVTAVLPKAAVAASKPATQKNPAASAKQANCNSNQAATKITSGKNKGKYYCKAKPNAKGGSTPSNGNNSPSPSAAAISSQCSHSFFGLVPWYNYLGPEFTTNVNGVGVGTNGQADPCSIKCFNIFTISQSEPANACGVRHSDIPYVLLAIVDDLLRVAGIVAVIFVIVGAFRYVTSQGNPDDTAGAQNTIINALIGLAISIVAVAFVSYVGSRL